MSAGDPNEMAELNLSRLKADHESGDRQAAIMALKMAWWFRVPVPDWALRTIAVGFGKWSSGDARTIDEALGVERSKGWRKPRPEHFLASLAWQKGIEMLKAGRARDESFKEDLAAHCSFEGMSVGKTLAYEMFLQWEREIDRHMNTRQKVKPAKSEKSGFTEN